MPAYEYLIPQNTAVKGARRIGIYNLKGNRVGFIPLGNLEIPMKVKKYSFGALSDIHLQYETGLEDFQRAMTYLNNIEQISFTCISGDLVVNGTETELQQYKVAVEQYSPDTPVYAAAGNHEYYAEKSHEYFIENVGNPLYYSFQHGNDVFIMVGVTSGNEGSLFEDGELQWLYEILEENRNRRCFLFEHVPPEEGCGDILNLYPYTKLRSAKESLCFKSLLKHYTNVVYFHGHTHTKFYHQKFGDMANYDRVFGCHSVHIPSLAVPRDDPNYDYAGSEGYVVDVYETGIHLRGRDFVKAEFLPIASYWLDTTIQEVDADTYVDETGTIIVNSPIVVGDLMYKLSKDKGYYSCVGVVDGVTATTITVEDAVNGLPVLTVGEKAFSSLTGLTKVIFTETPVSIADDAFLGCDSLATIVMPSDPGILDGSPWGSGYLRPRFEIGGVIYRRHNTTSKNQYIVDGLTSAFKGGTIEFPERIGGTPVYEIDASCFKNKTTITELIISSAVYTIEASVCSGCTGLKKVTFKGTPKSIPATAFNGCTNLLDIYVPWAEGAKADAPWGATNATIHYNYSG